MTDALAFVVQGMRISIPYVFAALGGTVCERAGVINLALEAMLLCGAFGAMVGAHVGAHAGWGILAGMIGGLLVAFLYATCVLWGRANQIIAGIALNLLALGLTRYLLKMVFNSASSSPTVPGLDGLFAELACAFVTALIVVGVHVWLAHTPSGLRLRAVGDHPTAADSLGVSVSLVRWLAILASGLLTGLGGAWLALSNHGFVDRMSGGRGYIAITAVILGRWHPLGAAVACLLFGFADALQFQLQSTVVAVPRELLQSLPYVLTLGVLMSGFARTRAPAALGVPFVRG